MNISPKLQIDHLQHLLSDVYVGDRSMELNPEKQTEGHWLSMLFFFLIIWPFAILPFCKQ